MLKAFFDDSGTSPVNRIAAVAGYVANAYHWERFNSKWKSLLRDYRVKILRRSDLESLKGEYSDWDKEKQIEFLKRAHFVIKKTGSVPISSCVVKDDFERIIPKDLKEILGGVYGWCAHDCLMKVEHWCDQKKYKGRIFYVFEAGTKGHGQIDLAMRLFYRVPVYKKRFRIQGWTFHDKTMLPLQAADVIAYEVFKFGENEILDDTKRRRFRVSADDLTKNQDLRYLGLPWQEQNLKKWLTDWGKHHPELAARAIPNSTS